MKKLTLFIFVSIVCLFSCKKKDTSTPIESSTKGNIIFVAYIKEFGQEKYIKSVEIKIAKSPSDLINGILISTLTTDVNGKAATAQIEQGSYYFKATYMDGAAVYVSESNVNINQAGTFTKNLPLKQTDGPCTLKIKVVKPSAGADSLIQGASIGIDYVYQNVLGNNPMAQGITNAEGIAEFNSLNADTVYCSIKTQNYSNTLGFNILSGDRHYTYRVEL